MSSLSFVNASAALLVLQRTSTSFATAAGKASAADLVETANGVSKPGVSGAGGPAQQARGKATEALFDTKVVDVNEMKVNLMERLGKEFGLSMDDFESVTAFGRAVKEAVDFLKRQEGGDLKLREIERKLELDELGISLDTLVKAMIDPESDADDALEAALLKQAGQDEEKAEALARLGSPTLDDIGIYGF